MGVISNILKFVGLTPAGPSGSWHIPVNTIKMITVDEELQKVYVYIDGEGQDLVNHDYIEITAPNKYVAKIADSLSMIITNYATIQETPVVISNKNVKRSSPFAYITKLEYISVGPNPEIELCCDTSSAQHGNEAYCTIPDPAFRAALDVVLGPQTWVNTNQIALSTVNVITDLDVSNKNINDLTGIQCFTALEYLNCFNNNLTGINLSQNTALDYLNCNNNYLTNIDVSQNLALTALYCYFNQLTILNVSLNTGLDRLYCGSNQLTSLDVSQNIALMALHCAGNPLGINGGILDVSQNTALTYLHCGSNQLTSLDVSQNIALTYLYCIDNQLTSLNVSQNTALNTLNCGENQLTSLNVSINTALTYLNCYYNQLNTLNIANGSIPNCGIYNASNYFNALYNPNVAITINQANVGNYTSGTCVDSTATFIAV